LDTISPIIVLVYDSFLVEQRYVCDSV